MNFISKIKIVIFTIISFIRLDAQKLEPQFDSMIILQPERMLDQRISRQEIINWNNKMLEKAKKNNYQKGIIWANINLGIQYYNLAKPDISLKHLNAAKKLADEISADVETYAKIYQEFSQVYYTLGLLDISMKYNAKALYWGNKIPKSSYKNRFLNFAYNSRAGSFTNIQSDSALYYYHKSASVFVSPTTYSGIADYYIRKNIHLDSAKFYLNKAEALFKAQKDVNPYSLSVLYYRYGLLHAKDNRNDEVIKFLEKSLLYASNGKNRQHLLNVYNLLAETYNKTGDIDKEKKILDEYKKFNESYKDAQAKSVQITIENLEKELTKKENKPTSNIFIYFLFLALLIGLASVFYFIRNKKVPISEENIVLEEHIESINDNVKPIVTLDDLYESAKTRDPNFYTKFQNLYPDFFKNISEINSEIQKNELHLLAYIYLNFETKEIADILFLSPKTIQNKKHNIRKKLNIQSSEDLYIWLKSFYQ